MNALEKKLKLIQSKGKKGLSLFITAGYKPMEVTTQIIVNLHSLGVDFFEIGFPFSDPIADGPVIQKSSEIALKNGMNWDKLLQLGLNVRRHSDVPLVLMSYANPLFIRTWEKSAKDLSKAGFNGVIVPDLSLEEASFPRKILNKEGLDLIQLVAPTSGEERIRKIVQTSNGFVYCVSVTGVTGDRKDLPVEEIEKFLSLVLKGRIPAYLGFGISNPKQIRKFKKRADGFIIGSAFIKFLEKQKSTNIPITQLKNFIGPFLEEVNG